MTSKLQAPNNSNQRRKEVTLPFPFASGTGGDREEREMDLLPAEETLLVARKHGFRFLKLVNVDEESILAEKPFGVDYGRLENGLHYYVRSNSKPRMRAALALAVKVG